MPQHYHLAFWPRNIECVLQTQLLTMNKQHLLPHLLDYYINIYIYIYIYNIYISITHTFPSSIIQSIYISTHDMYMKSGWKTTDTIFTAFNFFILFVFHLLFSSVSLVTWGKSVVGLFYKMCLFQILMNNAVYLDIWIFHTLLAISILQWYCFDYNLFFFFFWGGGAILD